MANLLSTTVNGQLNTGNVIDLGYTVNGSIGTTAFRGINFHAFSDFNYYIGKPAGAWTQPLHIHFYTGIWLRSHQAYGGTRFYNIATGSQLMSVGDGSDIVNVYSGLTVSGSITTGGNAVIHAGNIGSQSVNYANSSGSVAWGNISGIPNLDYQQAYTFTAPSSDDGSGYVWVRVSMGGFNSGGDFVRFSINRAIFWNDASPYGGPSMEVTAYAREWHGGQEGAVITYAQHGSVPGSGWITHAGPRDLAGSGYWFYMRIWGGVDYVMRVYRGSGPIGTSWEKASDPGNVYLLKTGLNNIGSNDVGINTNGDVYGTRFYDYSDSAYYGDFNSRSVLSSLQLGSAPSDTSNLSLDVQGNMAIRGSSGLYFGVTTNNYNSWSTRIYASGSTQYFNAQSFIFDNQGYGGTTFVTINGAGIYNNFWYRNYGEQGMYNQSFGTHFYSNGGSTWAITGSGGNVELQFRSNHQSTVRGYVYADTSNQIGFLNNGGSWALRTDSSNNAFVHGINLTINADGAGSSSIIMNDSDEGSREIHCNSNRIGFLTQAGAWGSWCDDNGAWNSIGNISGNYLYSNYSIRVGEIWGLGGLYRSSGDMAFGTEDGGWTFRYRNGEKLYIATDGNIYMAWAGAYISTLLDDKQDKSTAINTGNIGDQSVSYANSSSQSNVLAITGYGNGNMSYYQSPGTFAGQSGWAGYFISNHGDGATYYNQTIIMPFWGPPQYSRLQGGTFSGLYTFWSTENMDAPNKSGTSYYQTNTWMQFNGSYGLYWPSNYGAHFHANDGSTYTQFRLQGSKNGYGGIYDSHSRVNGFMYDDEGNGGVYREGNGLWYFYYHIGNGCMGIGTSTTSSSYKMYVAGTIYATGDVIAYSDIRKKTNIVTIDNALDKVLSMRGVFYDKVDEPQNGRQVGVIAQEVNQVLPEAVSYASDIDEYGVKYGNIVGVLIEAIKEQQDQINKLKAKLDGLTK